MIIILLACALFVLLLVVCSKTGPPGSGPPVVFPAPETAPKKARKKAAKFKLIKVLKQRKIDAVRRGFDVRKITARAGIAGGRPASEHFHKVKRKSYVNPGFPVAGAYIFI